MKIVFSILLLLSPITSFCQESLTDFDSPVTKDSVIPQKQLYATVDALAFFRDNEYSSKLSKGYSLPGTWVRPALNYDPNKNIHIEAGIHALFFDGANKYPNYAYHDIGTWKGNQYQSGAHLLPWFRAVAKMKDVIVVLGDIYGDQYHEIITPLYNMEQIMSADPEMGAQIIVDRGGYHADIFLNWQSYQFNLDTHQEAFTVGVTSSLRLTKEINGRINILAQHRGGEQDVTNTGVQTLSSGSIGLDWNHKNTGKIDSFNAQVNLLGCYQQAGKMWPFNSGYAFHGEGGMDFAKHFALRLGYVYTPKNFVSLYGNPFFSTISIKDYNTQFKGLGTGYCSIDYHHNFGENYILGANLETFQLNTTNHSEFNFSFGLYIRVKPWFKI